MLSLHTNRVPFMHSVVCIVSVERNVQTIHKPVDTPASEVFSRPSTQRFNFGLARGNVVPDRWTGDRIQRVELDRETIYRQQNVAMNPANKPANKPAAKKAVAKKAAAKKSANKPANKPAAKTAVAWL